MILPTDHQSRQESVLEKAIISHSTFLNREELIKAAGALRKQGDAGRSLYKKECQMLM